MFKQNRIISFIICLNLHESRISTNLLFTSQLSNYVELIMPLSSTKNYFLYYSACLVFSFLKDIVLYGHTKVRFDQTNSFLVHKCSNIQSNQTIQNKNYKNVYSNAVICKLSTQLTQFQQRYFIYIQGTFIKEIFQI